MMTHVLVKLLLQCQDAAAFLQYKLALYPLEQYQKVLKPCIVHYFKPQNRIEQNRIACFSPSASQPQNLILGPQLGLWSSHPKRESFFSLISFLFRKININSLLFWKWDILSPIFFIIIATVTKTGYLQTANYIDAELYHPKC